MFKLLMFRHEGALVEAPNLYAHIECSQKNYHQAYSWFLIQGKASHFVHVVSDVAF